MAAGMALTVAENIMRADVVDYECERSGKYMPSVVAGTYSFIDKTISAFGSTIALVCISFIGYANSTPQAGDTATWPIFWMTMFLMSGMPILGWICNIAAMRFYALDKERMVQVRKNADGTFMDGALQGVTWRMQAELFRYSSVLGQSPR